MNVKDIKTIIEGQPDQAEVIAISYSVHRNKILLKIGDKCCEIDYDYHSNSPR